MHKEDKLKSMAQKKETLENSIMEANEKIYKLTREVNEANKRAR